MTRRDDDVATRVNVELMGIFSFLFVFGGGGTKVSWSLSRVVVVVAGEKCVLCNTSRGFVSDRYNRFNSKSRESVGGVSVNYRIDFV